MTTPTDPQPPESNKDQTTNNDPFAWAIDQIEKMRDGKFDVDSIKNMVDTAKEKMGGFFNGK